MTQEFNWSERTPTRVIVEVARALIAGVVIGWLPGYAWSRVLLPRYAGVARFVISTALSIALVTLILYYGNVLFGIRISGVQALIAAFAATAVPVTILLARSLNRWLSTAKA